MVLGKTIGKAPCGGACSRDIGRVHDLMERALDLGQVRFADLVADVPDLVRPAALHEDRRRSRCPPSGSR